MFKCADVNETALIISPFTGRKLKLLAREKKLILKSWHSLPDQKKVCESIFATVFRKIPSLKSLWGLEDVCEEDLPFHKAFHLHAQSFFKFLDVAVRSINLEGDYLVMCARNVGIRHCYFKGVSFDAENWLTFKNSVLECLVEYSEVSDEQQFKSTWNLLLTFIITGNTSYELSFILHESKLKSLLKPKTHHNESITIIYIYLFLQK